MPRTNNYYSTTESMYDCIVCEHRHNENKVDERDKCDSCGYDEFKEITVEMLREEADKENADTIDYDRSKGN